MNEEKNVERMSPDLPMLEEVDVLQHHHHLHHTSTSATMDLAGDLPTDLRVRRKLRPVPPPLDLSKRTLVQYPDGTVQPPTTLSARGNAPCPSPRSPFLQKNLPLRKRAHSWSSQPGALNASVSTFTLDSSIPTIKDEQLEPVDEDSSCCRCSNSSLRISGLPTPHTPHTPHPHSAIPVLTSKFNFSEGNTSSGGPSHHHTSGPLNLSLGGGLPSSLLSPAPSHPSTSSLSSSREELEPDTVDPSYSAAVDCSGSVSFVNINYFHCSPHPCCPQPRELERSSPSSRIDDNQLKYFHLPYQPVLENDASRGAAGVATPSTEPYFKSEYCPESAGAVGPLGHQGEYAEEHLIDMSRTKTLSTCKAERPASTGTRCSCSNCSAPRHLSPYAQIFSDGRDLGWHLLVWSVFLPDVRVHFFMGEEMSSMRLSQDLGKLEKEHLELYACHGVVLRKYSYVPLTPETQFHGDDSAMPEAHMEVKMYFSPVGIKQQDVMAVVPPHHPFYVQDRGWCSVEPALTYRVHGFAVSQLFYGDVCLPSYHKKHETPCLNLQFTPNFEGSKVSLGQPLTHMQPSAHPQLSAYTQPGTLPLTDLTHATDHVAEAMSRFDFNDDPVQDASAVPERSDLHCPQYLPTPFSAASFVQYAPPVSHGHSGPQAFRMEAGANRSGLLSPPASPSKKNTHASGAAALTKPRRPMNGFMLFAKRHRLKLIQQHPGKDNRAISVLLGCTWKTLPECERERYNNEARLQAEQMKKIDPDCWKRKRSHSTC
ncbi:Ataxin AXH domain [Trinorchestia longiramus]|nr:Ataxin AXH domain [Trinorchestia longiramus]